MKAERQAVEYCVKNGSTGCGVAARVRLAGTSPERRRGLAGLNGLAKGSGLWIAPCEAIHTFGMHFPIDALFLDRQLRIRKITQDLQPWRVSFCLSADSVLELEGGAVGRSGVRLGDVLTFEPTAADDEGRPL